jgi:hypothetical protein
MIDGPEIFLSIIVTKFVEREKRLFRIMLVVARNIAKFWLQAKYMKVNFLKTSFSFFFPPD